MYICFKVSRRPTFQREDDWSSFTCFYILDWFALVWLTCLTKSFKTGKSLQVSRCGQPKTKWQNLFEQVGNEL